MTSSTIRTVGPAQITAAGRDVVAFHLHRYLAHWLAKHDIDQVWVSIGFEYGLADGCTIAVARKTSSDTEVPWTFEDLAASYHRGANTLAIERDSTTTTLLSIPLREKSHDGVPALLGFVLADGSEDLSSNAIAELEVHASEAIRSARRNGIRLFFDECDERDVKALLYAALERLPEWSGCDVAAAVVLSQSLRAMSVDGATEADFYVMAERLFVPGGDDEPVRFVGMSIDTGDEVRTVVDAALERLGNDGTVTRFVRDGTGYVDEDGEPARSIGMETGRPEDASSYVVPLVVDGEERELIGFLCLAFSGIRGVPVSIDETLQQLGEQLAYQLRYSPLYTLSSSKLRLVQAVRAAAERAVARTKRPASERRSALIASVVELVKETTEVPAFSIGWIRPEPRTLVYETSFGWTDFDSIELPVDIDTTAPSDSGVSALAARLNRPITLAGGRHMGDHKEFKNYLWVDETNAEILDERSPAGEAIDRAKWKRLGDYYKPARRDAYATVAHPISFDGHPLGVLALEVDRDTSWYWWAGYGSLRLWELVTAELAFAFWAFENETS